MACTEKLTMLCYCYIVTPTQSPAVCVLPSETNNGTVPNMSMPMTPQAATSSSHLTVTTPSVINNDSRTPMQNWSMNFIVPFDKFPVTFNKSCADKVRATKTDILEVVRRLGDEITKVTSRPGSANLAVIASAIVAKFPSSLADYANGQLIGDGSKSLHRRLIKHFENRPHVGNSLKKRLALEVKDDVEMENNTTNEANIQPTAKKTKKMKAKSKKDSFGCSNWQPSDLPDGETWETQDEKRVWLTSEFKKAEIEIVRVKEYMKVTYISQRVYINKQKPTMNLVMEQWPFLLQEDHLLCHFETLMGFNLVHRMESFFDQRGMAVFSLAQAKGCAAVKQMAVQLDAVAKHVHNVLSKTAGSVLLLPGLLKE